MFYNEQTTTADWKLAGLACDLRLAKLNIYGPAVHDRVVKWANDLQPYTDRTSYLAWVAEWKKDYKRWVAEQRTDKAVLRQRHTEATPVVQSRVTLRARILTAMLWLRAEAKKRSRASKQLMERV